MKPFTSLVAQFHHHKYPIFIGKNILTPDCLSPYIQGTQVMMVSDERVAPLYGEAVRHALSSFQVDTFIMPAGEQHKTIDTFHQLLNACAEKNHRRDTTLISVGGGVVSDMAGFAAACYHRGVAFIQIPTSLLAQVDASIGGKTAVNLDHGKNLVGAFYQPHAVFIDLNCLSTLPEREFRAGLAEIIKIALIQDKPFFEFLEHHWSAILQKDLRILQQTIQTACALKLKIVMQDEKEAGLRMILNFGHTLGHAIEHHCGYGNWLHGEAVSAGMIGILKVCVSRGYLSEDPLHRVETLLKQANLPTTLPESLQYDTLVNTMMRDKKVRANVISMVVLKGIGEAIIVNDISPQELQALLNQKELAYE